MDGPGKTERGIVTGQGDEERTGGGTRVNKDWGALSKGKEQPQVLLSAPCEGPLFLLAL